MAERLNATVLKTVRTPSSWVRIPPAPFLHEGECLHLAQDAFAVHKANVCDLWAAFAGDVNITLAGGTKGAFRPRPGPDSASLRRRPSHGYST